MLLSGPSGEVTGNLFELMIRFMPECTSEVIDIFENPGIITKIIFDTSIT